MLRVRYFEIYHFHLFKLKYGFIIIQKELGGSIFCSCGDSKWNHDSPPPFPNFKKIRLLGILMDQTCCDSVPYLQYFFQRQPVAIRFLWIKLIQVVKYHASDLCSLLGNIIAPVTELSICIYLQFVSWTSMSGKQHHQKSTVIIHHLCEREAILELGWWWWWGGGGVSIFPIPNERPKIKPFKDSSTGPKVFSPPGTWNVMREIFKLHPRYTVWGLACMMLE